MTNAERQALNKRIALAMGWTKETPSQSFDRRDVIHKQFLWIPPLGQYENEPLNTHPPDFTRKWEHAGPLLIELYKNNWRLCWGSGVFWMEPPPQITWDWHDGCAEEAPEAIAVAFDAWKEGEK